MSENWPKKTQVYELTKVPEKHVRWIEYTDLDHVAEALVRDLIRFWPFRKQVLWHIDLSPSGTSVRLPSGKTTVITQPTVRIAMKARTASDQANVLRKFRDKIVSGVVDETYTCVPVKKEKVGVASLLVDKIVTQITAMMPLKKPPSKDFTALQMQIRVLLLSIDFEYIKQAHTP